MNTPLWQYIPAELRARPQWAVAGPDKSPWSPKGYRASVTDPRTWGTFDQVASYAYVNALNIGYVIAVDDPFTCIDLDWIDEESQRRKHKEVDPDKWSTAADANRYYQIMKAFMSYTERSVSGKGLHIWVRGRIGFGCRRDSVEVYSQERFIVCTGDRLAGLSPNIEERQQLLEMMIAEMRVSTARNDLVEVDSVATDYKIIDSAINADNAAKFNDLCRGDWRKYGYPSQSEADLSLLSMLAFYSKSNDQVRRLFRATALGKRDKAVKNDRYINYTLRLIRGRMAEQASDAKVDGIAERMANQLLARLKAQLR